MKALRSLIVGAVLVLASLAALPTPSCCAAFLFTALQVGDDVVVTGSGTIDTAGLSEFASGLYLGDDGTSPSTALLSAGSATRGNAFGGVSGPSDFGTGSAFVTADSDTGDFVEIDTTAFYPLEVPNIILPTAYTSGSLLTDSDIFADATFATLGFTPGTYTYTLGSGDNTDTLTVDVVPEPSTWALSGVGTAGLLAGLTLKRCRAHRA